MESCPSKSTPGRPRPTDPRSWIGAALLSLCACGRDPILDRADELDVGPAAGTPGGGGGGGGGGGQPGPAVAPSPVDPAEPTPGSPAQPPPGSPAQPPPGSPAQPPPGSPGQAQSGTPGGEPVPGAVDVGPTVTLRGEVRLPDYDLGTVRLDIFDGDQRNLEGARPSVVGVLTLERPGPFEVQVPESATRVWLGAYVDEDLDGRPGPQDPAGWYVKNPVLTEGGADGIVIDLVRQPPPPQHGL